ncbi:MAG: protein translocase subunit SecF [Polyangiaceae bacterium]
MEFFKAHKTYNFMGQRKFWISLSFFLTLASIVLTFYPGPNYGTDFRGGTEVEIAFKKPVSSEKLHDTVRSTGKFSEPDILEVRDGIPNHFILRVQEVTNVTDDTKAKLVQALCFSDDPKTLDPAKCPADGPRATEVKFSAGGDKITTRYDATPDMKKIAAQVSQIPGVALRQSDKNPSEVNVRDHRVEIQLKSAGDELISSIHEKLGSEVVPDRALRVEWVGGKAGKQLRDSARNSVVIAIVFIMLYLVFRFDVRFAPGVIIACVHDAMVVIGVFILLHKEVTLSTIAAVLTIVGYSMNDTVVVYDRIRENLTRYKGKSFAEIINMSVSETLSRTLLTSGATMLSVLAFFIWGTGVIKDFALAMVIGIVAGTYSSIYVAAPLTEWIDAKLRERQKNKPASASTTLKTA